jgi:hypothetical protein
MMLISLVDVAALKIVAFAGGPDLSELVGMAKPRLDEPLVSLRALKKSLISSGDRF